MSNKNFKDLLSSIDALNESSAASVYVPSIKQDVPFSPMSVKQQKKILASGIDNEVENLSFMNALNDIICENCRDGKVKILTCDKPLIILQLRKQAVGDKLTITENDQDYNINLNEHIESCKNLKGVTKKTFELTHDTITITGRIPTLATDTQYNKHFTQSVKKNTKTKVKITDIIGDIYVSELVKYIDTITIGEVSVSAGDDLTPANAVQLFESLPLQVSTKLAEEVKNLREYENECLTSSALPEGVNISIDAGLFTASE